MFYPDGMFWFICTLLVIIGWLAMTLLLMKNVEEKSERSTAQRALNIVMLGLILIALGTAFYPNTFAESGIIVSQR